MQKFHNESKRALAMILSLAMILPTFMSLFVFGVAAVGEETYATKNDGQVIAENYDLTEEEKELLKSGYLIGATQTYQVPNASNDLISVDIDHKTIEMKSFPGSDGSVWKPVSVDIVVGNNLIEHIDGFTGNKVSYQTDESAFAVKVQYEGKNSVDADVQNVLLNASAILKGGMDNLEAILDPAGDIQKALDKFASISMTALPADSLNPDIDGMPVFQVLLEKGYKIVSPFGLVTVSFTEANSEKEPASKIWAQLEANGGKFNLTVIAKEYAEADSKVQFLVENAERIMNEVANTRAYLLALNGDWGALSMLATYAPAGMLKDTLGEYVGAITQLAGNSSNAGLLDDYATGGAWDILSVNPLRTNLTDSEYILLDAFVEALGDDIKGASNAVVNPLVVGTTTIQFNMSMYNVSVKVQLNVIVANQLVPYGSEELVLTFAENATEGEILEAIANSDIENDAIDAWGEAFVAAQYDRVATQLPANLTDDVDYTITYNPKTYEVDYLGESRTCPYGYQILLPVHANSSQAYDYKVNGAYYAQGTSVTITEPTIITRSVGKAYTSYPVIDKLVVENFFAGNDDGSKKAVAILTSGAINSIWAGVNVDVRLPESEGLITLVGDTLTAGTYASSYKGLDWVPYSYTVNGNVHYFNGTNTVTITEPDYDNVQIEYRLIFTNITGIQDLLDLPGILAEEADSQISALEALNLYYAQMGEIGSNKFALSVLATAVKSEGDTNGDDVIEDADMKELYDAINGFANHCFDGDSLKIYNLLSGYREYGLVYYYENSAKFTSEIDVLNGYLGVIGKYKTELKEIVTASLSSMLNPDQLEKVNTAIDKIDELRGAIDTLKKDLKAPNEALINLDSENLGKLAEALEMVGTVPSAIEKPMYLSENFVKAADGKVSLNIKVQGATVIAPTFVKGHLLTKGDIDTIVLAVESKMAELAYDEKYYTCDFDRAVFDALVGTDVATLVGTSYEFYYTINQYEVEVEGVNTNTVIDINNLTVNLPASTDPAYRYEYIIFGKNITSKSYKFTPSEFDQIIKAGGYKIVREEIDVAEEEHKALINNLNTAIGSNLVVFALTEKNGEYSVVMKIDASNPTALMGAFTGMMTELMKNDYVAFDEHAMIYTGQDGMQISLQALINTVLDSGFSSSKLIGMMSANGTINNMAMPGAVVSDKAMNKAGALLAKTELCLGDSKTDLDYELPMYITLGGVSSQIVGIRNLFADRLGAYFGFKCEGGELSLDITLPQKAYEAYLAGLLATDTVDFTNINNINEQVAFGFMQDVIDPLLTSGVSVKAIQKTLAKFGYNLDLSGYETEFELVRDIYLGAHFEYNNADSTYDTTLNISIDSYLDKLNLGVIGNMIAEKGEGIEIPIAASLTNLDKNFEAIYFDMGAAGAVNKVGFAEDISAKLGSISGTAVVILLKDIDDTLRFNTTTILNLNGFDVKGDIVGRGKVTVVDNNANGYDSAVVSGKVSGNVTVTGGKFTNDVSAFLPNGYVQNASGVVAHKYVNVVTDANENISVNIDASLFKTNTPFDVKSLAVDVVVEMLLVGFTNNQLTVNGEKVFDLTVDDVVSIVTAADRKAALLGELKTFADLDSLNRLLNTLIDDMTDFDAIKVVLDKNIANGTNNPIISYDATTSTWDVDFDYKEDSDTIEVDIIAKEQNSSKLNLVITGSKADQQYVADLVDILAEGVDVDFNANVSKKPGTTIGVAADGKVDVQLSEDPAYAVLLSVIVADGIGAPANMELVLGLKAYFTDGSTYDLQQAFNELTFKQIMNALKRFGDNKTLESMLTNIGLARYYDAETAALEGKLHNTVYVISKLLNKLNLGGSAAVIGNYLDADTNTYVFDKQDVVKSFTFSGVTLDLEVTELVVKVKLFEKEGAPVVDTIDYTELENEIAKIKAEGLVGSKYTAESWSKLVSALNTAIKLVENKNATSQGQVETILNNLKIARKGLKEATVTPQPPVDEIKYTALENAIAKIEAENLVESKYTAESWARLQSVMTIAKSLVENKTAASQEQVDNVLADLVRARDGLKEVTAQPPVEDVDYTKLKEEIAKIEGLNREDYTPETWNNLMIALQAARDALDSKSQAEVNTVTNALSSALQSLKRQEVKQDKDNNSWIWIVIVAVVLVGGGVGAFVYITISRKKKLADNTPLVDINAGDAKPADAAPAEETPAEEAPVEEAPAEEAPVEEAPAESGDNNEQ